MWYPGSDLDPALSGLCVSQNSVLQAAFPGRGQQSVNKFWGRWISGMLTALEVSICMILQETCFLKQSTSISAFAIKLGQAVCSHFSKLQLYLVLPEDHIKLSL